jgi:fatty acid desaturase
MVARSETLTISPTGSFEELAARVKAAGLLASRPGYYLAKILFNLFTMAACWTAVFLLGDSWWQLVVAVVLALVYVQTGFIAHDTGHNQISTNRRARRVLGLLHMNLLIGVAYGWWINHHNRHHNNPNNLDQDPDTLRRIVIFDKSEMPVKATSGFRRFIIRFQSVMFFVLLSHEAWRLHSAGFKTARAGMLRSARLELGLVLVHAIVYFAAIFAAMPLGLAIAFVLVNKVVFGWYLGAVFAPNHKGMVVYRSDVELDWMHRQVLTSRNIRSSRFTDLAYGGLNYQIEHHLFPAMPRVNLRRVRPIVLDYCRQHGIPYGEVSVWESYRAVARYLGKVSDEARNGTDTAALPEAAG